MLSVSLTTMMHDVDDVEEDHRVEEHEEEVEEDMGDIDVVAQDVSWIVEAVLKAPEAARLCPVVHTPHEALSHATGLLDLQPHDTFIDLGSGDGRVVFAAAQYTFVRSIGVELNPVCHSKAVASQSLAGLSNIEFWQRDMFTLGTSADLTAGPTTKVFVYASQPALRRLSPLLYAMLNQGATVLTYFNHLSIRPRVAGLGGMLHLYHSKA